MKKTKKEEFDFRLYEKDFGTMYHLLLDRPIDGEESVRYVNDSDNNTYATVHGKPIFFNWDKEFRIATEYIIMYPKIYIQASAPYPYKESLSRIAIH